MIAIPPGSMLEATKQPSPPSPLRRTLLLASLASVGLATSGLPRSAAATVDVANITGLYTVRVAAIEQPRTTDEVAVLIRAWPGRIAVGGGRYSMGGQTAIADGLQIDMRAMNDVVWLRPHERRVRVQAGMRWRDLQDVLDPLDLAVKTMQSYANFTIGGSVSVNAHGRYVGHGPVGHTVRALQIVLADGSVVECDRSNDPTLFRAAIGGYGSVGVVTEVELDVAENLRIERRVDELALDDYVAFFDEKVLSDHAAVLHNADLVPPMFDRPVAVTWLRTSKPLTDPDRLLARGERHRFAPDVAWLITEMPGGESLNGSVVHPWLLRDPVVKWLNREASLDVASLEPRTRTASTYVLQEYFVPKRNFAAFARGMSRVLRERRVEALNVSIRHSPPDEVALIPWAKEEVFAFVLYYKQRAHVAAREAVGAWTRELVDLALANDGRYYLPYQLHATQSQFVAPIRRPRRSAGSSVAWIRRRSCRTRSSRGTCERTRDVRIVASLRDRIGFSSGRDSASRRRF